MTKKDLKGREYASLHSLRPGDKIQVDADFTCVKPWSTHEVKESEGQLYFECKAGQHFLDGQLDFEDEHSFVGVYKL